MELWTNKKGDWMVMNVGKLPNLETPVTEMINDLLRQEELGKIERPYFLVLSPEDEHYISINSLARSLFSSDTNWAFLLLVAVSEPARTLFENENPPKPGPVPNFFGAGERWGISFLEKNELID